MRVIEVSRFGGPEVLVPVDVDDPVAGPGQTLIEVAAAEVLFLDTVVRRGAGGPYFPVRPPYVPGTGVAGFTSDGRRVVAETDGGGYAARVVAGTVIDVPAGVDLWDAAALLHDGRTAHGLIETTPVAPGDRVLVTAAGGGLGLLLVQLAVAAGARVVAAADRIRPVIGGTFPLDQAAGAHAALESRAVVGKTLLIP
jgi:NADPH2:quinone reductase